MWKLLILVGICLVLQGLAFADTLKKRIQLRKIFLIYSDQAMSLVDREDDGKQILVSFWKSRLKYRLFFVKSYPCCEIY